MTTEPDATQESGGLRYLRTLFESLCELPPAQRRRVLETRIDIDDATRRALAALLDADVALEGTTVRTAVRGFAPTDAARRLGERVGPFRLERLLGQGGMAAVYLAQRADGAVAQQVAIKLIRPELAAPDVVARFRLERQVLALLDHPNIARLLDLGELEDGAPYVVMEYVDGVPITEFVRTRRLGRNAVLQLFARVCDAVSHAHQNLIVHRDLKPSNILVRADGSPVILDFGIAKPLQRSLGVVNVEETSTGQRFFSPQSAPPELLRGESVGVACDVYALGVLLYELLCGRPPFDFRGLSPGEVERRVTSVDPLPPSERGARGSRIALADLDAIVMHCLRKEARERYASVESLAADVRNFLAGRPVAAQAGRVVYRVRKFLVRHRRALGIVLVFLVLLASGAWGLYGQYRRTLDERDRAESVTEFLIETFKSADPGNALGTKVTAEQILDHAASGLTDGLQRHTDARLHLLATVAEVEIALGSPEKALHLLDTAPASPRGLSRSTRLLLLRAQARAHAALSDAQAAEKALEQGTKLAADARERHPFDVLRAEALTTQGRYADALRIVDEQLALPGDPSTSGSAENTHLRDLKGRDLEGLRRPDDAYAVYQALVHDLQARQRDADPDLLLALRGLSRVAIGDNRIDEGLELSARVTQMTATMYGTGTLPYALALSDQSRNLHDAGRRDEALPLMRQARDIAAQVLGPAHPRVATAEFGLASLLAEHGSDDDANANEAGRHFRRAIEIGASAWPASHVELLTFRTHYACYLAEHGQYADVPDAIDPALAAFEAQPELRAYDIYPLAKATRAMAALGDLPTEETRGEVRRWLAAGVREGDKSAATLLHARRLVVAAQGLGVVLDSAQQQ